MRSLEAHQEAYKKKQLERDAEAHRNGIYFMSAVMSGIDKCLHGKNSKAEYMEKPILQQYMEENEVQEKELTEEEKQRQRNLFLANLMAMQSQFEASKDKEKGNE